MPIAFMDGFDSYNGTADLVGYKWAVASSGWTWSSNAGVTGLGAIVGTASAVISEQLSGWPFRYAYNSSAGQGWSDLGFWLKVSALPSTGSGANSSGNILAALTVFSTLGSTNSAGSGSNAAYIGILSSNGHAYISSPNDTCVGGVTNVCDNSFHWMDVQLSGVNNAIISFYVDGIFQNQAAQSQNPSTFVNLFLCPLPGGVTTTIDDLVVYSSVGGLFPVANANFPIGQQIITTLRPSGDSSVAFTPSSGTSHFVLVNGVGKSTATFVQSATLGADDIYTYPALGYTPTTINGVTINSYIENPSFGGILFNNVSFESSLSFGSSLGSSYYTPGTPFLQQTAIADNITASAWKSSTFANATFGIRVSTASS